MKQFLPIIAALWTAAATPLVAQSTVVVELFTSQGCSSCPPADKMIHELARVDNVIALSLHVDYWDYIGWKDEFADPRFADRQRGYAVEGGRRSIYTPQMIINGVTDVVGARPLELSQAITKAAAKPMPVALDLQRTNDGLQIKAEPTEADGPLVVHMMRYTPEREARITRGENAGHTLTYANVAEDWQILAEWDGNTPLSMTVDMAGDKPAVVLVQQGRHGPIVGAGRLMILSN